MAGKQVEQALALLEGLNLPCFCRDGLQKAEEHIRLIREWNHAISLVSQGDLAFLPERHLVDALSLLAVIMQTSGEKRLLDIGSGAGYPAIPMKCFCPTLDVTLVERSRRKAGFLQRVISLLGLEGVTVLTGEFPAQPERLDAQWITARAVERPKKVYADVLQRLPQGSVFLCQLEGVPPVDSEMFHVEHVEDVWQSSGLRRGSLRLIRKK
ncbi:MAG TPA: class I SAM-dependent methyltransferase [Candidatus Hydrogenedentes bacterium]|mgnify:FL=1|jgi:16S rRNA (guanine527-N7)-methyltransferase|nr:MAG: Ribosomal RNA small subunit methyltransferase G [Candidatus Hydrogenedentes bacterium ADurb.Bin170]HOM47468.1 class I SAM-dependent methyltransferase [Candidatus Hydrogenedentota bacterium]